MYGMASVRSQPMVIAPALGAGSFVRSLAPEEGQQVGVDLFLVRRREAVRRARIVYLLGALDQPGRFLCGVLDRDDLVVLAVQDQGWHVESLQVLGLVRFGKRLDTFVGVLEAGLHAPEPELIERALGDLRPG